MLSQKIRNENKFLDLQTFLSNLKDEEHYIKQITKVNLAHSQSTSLGVILSRGSSSLRTRGS